MQQGLFDADITSVDERRSTVLHLGKLALGIKHSTGKGLVGIYVDELTGMAFAVYSNLGLVLTTRVAFQD